MDIHEKVILITGGTGSLGNALVERLFDKFIPKKVIVFSRDEFKQSEMRRRFPDPKYDRLRFFIGDVRDKNRLKRAFDKVDVVIHAAALKQVPVLEYNPTEAVKTNVLGTMNVIDACIDCGVKKAIFISTDKAVNPVNLYGATKMAAEKMWIAANSYDRTVFSSVRYGNVIGSRGSVIPLFKSLEGDTAPVTDPNMTRFWITMKQAVDLVLFAIKTTNIGVHVPELKSMKMSDLAKCFKDKMEITGIRPGEKIHESLIADGEEVFFVHGMRSYLRKEPYNSKGCERFTREEMLCLINL
jgi:UDP-N-acetylglucosamine 4,6-dehydratase